VGGARPGAWRQREIVGTGGQSRAGRDEEQRQGQTVGAAMVGGDSVGVSRQAGGGETEAVWSDCGSGAGRPRDLVRHARTEGVGRVGRLGQTVAVGRAQFQGLNILFQYFSYSKFEKFKSCTSYSSSFSKLYQVVYHFRRDNFPFG
jgi:hypothetical protein